MCVSERVSEYLWPLSLPRDGDSALVEGEQHGDKLRAVPVDTAAKLLQMVICLVRNTEGRGGEVSSALCNLRW